MPLPLVKDYAIIELESIVRNKLAIPCNFIHADLSEANALADQLDPNTDFPVFLYLTQGKSSYKRGDESYLDRNVKIVGMFLNRIDDPTYKSTSSYNVQPYISQMRQLAENLIYWINQSQYSVGGGVNTFSTEDMPEKFDANLFGVLLTFEWDVFTNSNGYYNQAY